MVDELDPPDALDARAGARDPNTATRDSHGPAPAWIDTVSPSEAEGPLAETYEWIGGRSGWVANILRCQSLHPEGLKDHYGLYRTLMFGKGSLSRAERESIAVVVSAANGCRYCMEHHGAALRLLTRNDALVRSLAVDWRKAELNERLRAILSFAEQLTLEPQQPRHASLQPLRDAGLDDRGILEVVEVAAYFNFVNRIANGLGVSVEDDYR